MDEDLETENESKTLLWEDIDNRHSFLLVLPTYGLKLLLAKDIDADHTEITVYGAHDDIASFLSDFEEWDFSVLNDMSNAVEYDEDYEGWLNNEVWWQKQLIKTELAAGNVFLEDVLEA